MCLCFLVISRTEVNRRGRNAVVLRPQLDLGHDVGFDVCRHVRQWNVDVLRQPLHIFTVIESGDLLVREVQQGFPVKAPRCRILITNPVFDVLRSTEHDPGFLKNESSYKALGTAIKLR